MNFIPFLREVGAISLIIAFYGKCKLKLRKLSRMPLLQLKGFRSIVKKEKKNYDVLFPRTWA